MGWGVRDGGGWAVYIHGAMGTYTIFQYWEGRREEGVSVSL